MGRKTAAAAPTIDAVVGAHGLKNKTEKFAFPNDIDFCDVLNPDGSNSVYISYSWGNQQGTEFLGAADPARIIYFAYILYAFNSGERYIV